MDASLMQYQKLQAKETSSLTHYSEPQWNKHLYFWRCSRECVAIKYLHLEMYQFIAYDLINHFKVTPV